MHVALHQTPFCQTADLTEQRPLDPEFALLFHQHKLDLVNYLIVYREQKPQTNAQ